MKNHYTCFMMTPIGNSVLPEVGGGSYLSCLLLLLTLNLHALTYFLILCFHSSFFSVLVYCMYFSWLSNSSHAISTFFIIYIQKIRFSKVHFIVSNILVVFFSYFILSADYLCIYRSLKQYFQILFIDCDVLESTQ